MLESLLFDFQLHFLKKQLLPSFFIQPFGQLCFLRPWIRAVFQPRTWTVPGMITGFVNCPRLVSKYLADIAALFHTPWAPHMPPGTAMTHLLRACALKFTCSLVHLLSLLYMVRAPLLGWGNHVVALSVQVIFHWILLQTLLMVAMHFSPVIMVIPARLRQHSTGWASSLRCSTALMKRPRSPNTQVGAVQPQRGLLAQGLLTGYLK